MKEMLWEPIQSQKQPAFQVVNLVDKVIRFDDESDEGIPVVYGAYRLFENYFFTIYCKHDKFAAIEVLTPCKKPGYYVRVREVVTFHSEADIFELINGINNKAVNEIIRLIREEFEE
ncbi:hypothetical protein [Caldibacillus debilis]|uniref:Uncharacterized protein n=1 Tax=Caldibacillus debilis TaxID=301148 RepID=A0A150L6X3_9BACI|nr:hypothetical protein [Caldibacillus debilis]KYD08034.1 hypothetical protein B4135_4191 [Caldibacillus debilis]